MEDRMRQSPKGKEATRGRRTEGKESREEAKDRGLPGRKILVKLDLHLVGEIPKVGQLLR
eukprot:3941728-Rhodomonas_salina.1